LPLDTTAPTSATATAARKGRQKEIRLPALPGGLFQGQISQIWPYLDAPGLEKNGLALRKNLALIWPFSAIFSVNFFN
jgi:hypothetical protein